MQPKLGEYVFAAGGLLLLAFYIVLFLAGCDGKPPVKAADDNCIQHECCKEKGDSQK